MFFLRKHRTEWQQKLIRKYTDELDTIRCRMDMPESLLDEYLRDRKTEEFQCVFDKKNPLVTVCVATYNRGRLLTERTIPSILQQTYENLEVIVIGDCCQDDTEERISKINDQRIRFINLRERGQYPDEQSLRWMVAGTKPANYALSLARGDFITHLDDDDRYHHERLEKLLRFACEQRIEFIWHPFQYEKPDGTWKLNSAEYLAYGKVTTSSVFYHRWFARIGWDMNAYRLKEPGDWNRFRKFKYLGATSARHPESLLFHYKERNQSSGGSSNKV